MHERNLEKIFKALANSRRLAILKFLKRKGERSVSEVADEIKLSFKATSKHLLILENVRILEARKESLTKLYKIAPDCNRLIKKILNSL